MHYRCFVMRVGQRVLSEGLPDSSDLRASGAVDRAQIGGTSYSSETTRRAGRVSVWRRFQDAFRQTLSASNTFRDELFVRDIR